MFFKRAIGAGHNALVNLSRKKSILKHFGIKQEVFYADFNWAVIINDLNKSNLPKFQNILK
jgi:phenylalanyl-tRNA synthetase beta chain